MAPVRRPLALLYDADCGFCRSSLGAFLAWDRGERLRPVPIQSEEGRALTPGMSEEERLASFHVVTGNGTLRSGGDALPELFAVLPGGAPIEGLLRRTPGLRRAGYHAVSSRRDLFARAIPAAAKRRADRAIAERRARTAPAHDGRRRG